MIVDGDARVFERVRGFDELLSWTDQSAVFSAPDVEVELAFFLQLINQRLDDEGEEEHAEKISLMRPLQRADEVYPCYKSGAQPYTMCT